MLKFIKKIFSRSRLNENQDYFIPVMEQEQNNPNIKKVYVGGLTVDDIKNLNITNDLEWCKKEKATHLSIWWDGLKSDKVLVCTKSGKYHVAEMVCFGAVIVEPTLSKTFY